MNNWRIGLFVAIASLSLAGCKGGGAASPASSPATGSSANNSAEEAVRNSAPVITGAPQTAVTAGTTYLAQAMAFDSDGDLLTYSATGLPAWASINAQTGQLFGTPSESDVGTTGAIVVRVSDGRLVASLPAFQIVIASATGAPVAPAPIPGQNSAPTISGTPALSVASGAGYIFAPAASDLEGNTLGFSISGKPSWATFNVATGVLTGTAQAGTYAGIVISVSDGTSTTSLPAFTLSVGVLNTGTAKLTWSAPAQNTDGSALVDLVGYRVYHGSSADTLYEMVQVSGPNSTSYDFSELSSGAHYFAVAAYNSVGVESELSVIGNKTIM